MCVQATAAKIFPYAFYNYLNISKVVTKQKEEKTLVQSDKDLSVFDVPAENCQPPIITYTYVRITPGQL